jgi:hypothetical protein
MDDFSTFGSHEAGPYMEFILFDYGWFGKREIGFRTNALKVTSISNGRLQFC